jgi:hypothetical protein
VDFAFLVLFSISNSFECKNKLGILNNFEFNQLLPYCLVNYCPSIFMISIFIVSYLDYDLLLTMEESNTG